MPQRRAVLHVGPHKTASTYLQCRLMLARDALAAHGFAYPEEGIAQFAHHQLYYFLHEATQANSTVTEDGFKRALAAQPNVILSSENFVYLSPAEFRRLRSLLVDFRIEIVLYLRSPVQLWPSHWQELVRQGRDVTFLEYLGACCGWTDVLLPEAVNPVAQIAKLATGFGIERLRILCLENILAPAPIRSSISGATFCACPMRCRATMCLRSIHRCRPSASNSCATSTPATAPARRRSAPGGDARLFFPPRGSGIPGSFP